MTEAIGILRIKVDNLADLDDTLLIDIADRCVAYAQNCIRESDNLSARTDAQMFAHMTSVVADEAWYVSSCGNGGVVHRVCSAITNASMTGSADTLGTLLASVAEACGFVLTDIEVEFALAMLDDGWDTGIVDLFNLALAVCERPV